MIAFIRTIVSLVVAIVVAGFAGGLLASIGMFWPFTFSLLIGYGAFDITREALGH